MKNLKKVLAIVLVALLVFSLAACGTTSNTKETTTSAPDESTETTQGYTGEKVKVAAIKGPTGMGMVNLMYNDRYDFTLISDPTEVVSLISTDAVDIAACPLNVAANLYKKTGGKIKILGINTLGVLYVVTNGVTVNSIIDLAGKTIYATGQGATPEFIINHILEKNGLTDVKVEYLSEHSELAAKVVSGDAQIAVLPEPFVTVTTTKNENVKVALSLTDEWNSVDSDTELAMGCVIARTDFIEKNPDAVKQFISDNKASVESVNVDAYTASSKMVEKGIIDEAVFAVNETSEKKAESAAKTKATEVITRCNIVFIDGEMMQTVADANFNVYFEADPTSIGGEKVSSDIYYVQK